jgi:hypothetical protein
MRIIAFVLDVLALSAILAHLGEPSAAAEVPRHMARRFGSRQPNPTGMTPPAAPPEFVFDQRSGR